MGTNSKEYTNAYQKVHYQANKAKYIAKAGRWRKKRVKAIQALKNIPCMDCGVQYPSYVMQFDHARGVKSFTISREMPALGLEKLLAEIAKCDVVCANCHAARTHNRRSLASSKVE